MAYIDLTLPFRFRSAPNVFILFTDVFEWLVKARGAKLTINFMISWLAQRMC